MMNERETPMTDAKAELVTVWRTTEGYVDIELVDADFARTLERMCAELAEVAADPCPYHFCGCDLCFKRDDVMTRYAAMKEGR